MATPDRDHRQLARAQPHLITPATTSIDYSHGTKFVKPDVSPIKRHRSVTDQVELGKIVIVHRIRRRDIGPDIPSLSRSCGAVLESGILTLRASQEIIRG
jgi:hypothetical protein